MKDRLIELLRKDNCCIDFDCSKCMTSIKYCYPHNVADKILADGWIRPPCKVGDYIWFLKNDKLTFGQIEDITIARNGLFAFVYEIDAEDEVIGEWSIPLCEIGKTVFLTREEAEKALEGGAER